MDYTISYFGTLWHPFTLSFAKNWGLPCCCKHLLRTSTVAMLAKKKASHAAAAGCPPLSSYVFFPGSFVFSCFMGTFCMLTFVIQPPPLYLRLGLRNKGQPQCAHTYFQCNDIPEAQPTPVHKKMVSLSWIGWFAEGWLVNFTQCFFCPAPPNRFGTLIWVQTAPFAFKRHSVLKAVVETVHGVCQRDVYHNNTPKGCLSISAIILGHSSFPSGPSQQIRTALFWRNMRVSDAI